MNENTNPKTAATDHQHGYPDSSYILKNDCKLFTMLKNNEPKVKQI